MAEKEMEEKWTTVSWEMGDVLKHIVRNYEDIQRQQVKHTCESIPYSLSCALLKRIIDNQRDTEVPDSVFFHALFKKASSKYSEITLFARMNHPDFPQIKTIPMIATSNKTDLPLNTMEEIQTYALTEEKIEITVYLDGIDESLTKEEIYAHSSIFLQIKPEYVQDLLGHDEKHIQEAMNNYEKQLRKELKETGRLACNKPRFKLS